MIITDVDPLIPASPLDAFLGHSPRKETVYVMPLLYNKSTDAYNRGKYGVTMSGTGTLYLPPKLIEQKVGTWRIHKFKIRARLFDNEYIVDKVSYKGEMYGSCLAVEIELEPVT